MKERFELVDRVDFIKNACKEKKVLHLGCTNYPYTKDSIEKNMLLHFDLEKISNELFGFDYDQEGLDILAEYGVKNLFQADLEKLELVQTDEKFDVIIAGEIIEHLNNPGVFLQGIKRFMTSETNLIVTTINTYSALRFAIYGLRGKGGRNEPVHPDHVAYYSYKTLSLILERHNLSVSKFCFYDLGEEHKKNNPWYYNLISNLGVKFTPHLSDGIIAVSRNIN